MEGSEERGMALVCFFHRMIFVFLAICMMRDAFVRICVRVAWSTRVLAYARDSFARETVQLDLT